jgi:hypothetical protein
MFFRLNDDAGLPRPILEEVPKLGGSSPMAERRSLGRRCRFIPRHPAPERTASSRRPAGMRWRLARAGQDLRTQTPVPFAQEPSALPKTSSCLNSPTSLHLLYRPLRATSVRSRAALAPYPVSPRRLSKLRRGLPSSAMTDEQVNGSVKLDPPFSLCHASSLTGRQSCACLWPCPKCLPLTCRLAALVVHRHNTTEQKPGFACASASIVAPILF